MNGDEVRRKCFADITAQTGATTFSPAIFVDILADLADVVDDLQDKTLGALEQLAEGSAKRSARVTQLEARVKALGRRT